MAIGVILLFKRFQAETDQCSRPNLSGFRPGRGCTDQIHNPHHTLEQRWRFQQATVMCFVDGDAAFNSVDRDSLWRMECPPNSWGASVNDVVNPIDDYDFDL